MRRFGLDAKQDLKKRFNSFKYPTKKEFKENNIQVVYLGWFLETGLC